MRKFISIYLALLISIGTILPATLTYGPSFARAEDEEDAPVADTLYDGTVYTDNLYNDEINNASVDVSVAQTDDDIIYSLGAKIRWQAAAPLQKPALAVGPQDDVNRLAEYKIDRSVSEYLLALITPTELGGFGINHIKVTRIENGYTSSGKGKNDRENASSLDEGSAVSAHNSGQAVDISEYGAVTCKLVSKSYLGGNSTTWLSPTGVKVAWQSTAGIANNPTPNAQSLMEAASLNSAQGMSDYLKSTGQMDAYADYVKGLNLSQIITYIGANIYMKNYATNSIVSDPLADSLIHVIGGAALEKAIPGLPDGMASGNNDEDARIAFAKAQIEEGLNLPSGSLRGYGWGNILNSVGERHLENALGLPSLYFENHSLSDLTTSDIVNTALKKFNYNDNSFNVPSGTISKILNNDSGGLTLAGVNILGSALKLTTEQQNRLVSAVVNSTSPDINLNNSPSDSKIGMNDLNNLFSADPEKQKEAQNALKQQGLKIVREAIKSASPSKFSGVTSALIGMLSDEEDTITLGDLKTSVAQNRIASDTGMNDSDKTKIGTSDKVNALFAAAVNDGLSLSSEYKLTSDDIRKVVSNGDYTVFNKIGGAQIDRAMGWDKGTGLKILNNEISTGDAFSQVASNAVMSMLGLDIQGVSLAGDISSNFANALIDSKLGLDNGTFAEQNTNADATSLYDAIGQSRFNSSFNLPGDKSLFELRGDSDFWDDQSNNSSWEAIDINNGLPLGTTKSYLVGDLSAGQYRKQVASYAAVNITADKVWNYFGLQDRFKISSSEVINLVKVISGDDSINMDNRNAAIQSLFKLAGRTVDQGSGFKLDSIASYFLSTDQKEKTNILLENGIRLFAKNLGLTSVFGSGEQGVNNAVEIIMGAFNTTDSSILRASYQQRLTNLVTQSIGIPSEYEVDAAAFSRGDFRTGYAAVTFTLYAKQINENLPADNQITYKDLRDTLIFDIHESLLMSQVLPQITTEVPIGSTVVNLGDGSYGYTPIGSNVSRIVKVDETTYEEKAEEYRKGIMQTNQKNVEYKVSDSLLRKADSTIPVGFSRAMFEGSDADRTSVIQMWAFNNVDKYLHQAESAYVPGTLEKIYKGQLSSVDTDTLITSIINKSGVSFGPFSTDFITNFYSFIKNSSNSNLMQSEFLKSDKYAAMWNYFDSWLGDNLGIGDIPSGLTQSIFLASVSDWDFNAQLKDGSGNVVVKSLNDYGEMLAISKLTQWADHEFGLPVGRVYQLYQAYTNYQKAFSAYKAVNASDKAAKAAAAKNATQAGNAVILIAVEIGLEMCDVCQAAFKSVDSALAAPAGFTQAALLGALQSALGLGPWGLVAAGVLYLFGTYDTDYLCPKSPYELYGITSYDPADDQLDYGATGNTGFSYVIEDEDSDIKYSPKPGTEYYGKFSENPFSWQEGVKWGNGDNQKLWMGWARHFTGKLVADTIYYGADMRANCDAGINTDLNDPDNHLQQTLTYRQANVEYFSPFSYAAFGNNENIDNQVGIFYTQGSTKITDWVHVGFGGVM